MPSQHELNEAELRTLFPDSPTPSALPTPTPTLAESPPPSDVRSESLTGFGKSPRPDLPSPRLNGSSCFPATPGTLASRRLPSELRAVCESLTTRFSLALRLTADERMMLERTDGEWLSGGELLWSLGADETIAVIDPQIDPQIDPLPTPHSSPVARNPLSLKIVLHNRLVRAILDKFLGGAEDSTKSSTKNSARTRDPIPHIDRPLTEIERRLARKALTPFAAVWLGLAPNTDATAGGHDEHTSDFSRMNPPVVLESAGQLPREIDQHWFAMFCYRVEIGAVAGRIRCVAPAEWVQALDAAISNRVSTRHDSLGRELMRLDPAARDPAVLDSREPDPKAFDSATQAALLRRAALFASSVAESARAFGVAASGAANDAGIGTRVARSGDRASESWTIELAEQALPAAALEDLRVGDVLRSDHPLDYPLLARAESGDGVVPVRVGMIDGKCVARRVEN